MKSEECRVKRLKPLKNRLRFSMHNHFDIMWEKGAMRMRLLLAEDEEAMAEAVVDYLEYHHYEVSSWIRN